MDVLKTMLNQIEHQRRGKMITELPDAETLLQRRRYASTSTSLVVSRSHMILDVVHCLSWQITDCVSNHDVTRRDFNFRTPAENAALPKIITKIMIRYCKTTFKITFSENIADLLVHLLDSPT